MGRLTIFMLLFAVSVPCVAHAQSSSTATGVSSAMNPAISVNGLFWGQASRDNDSPELNRVALQEAEVQFSAVVDPFWKATFTFAVHPAHIHYHEDGADTNQEAGHSEEAQGFNLDIEEAFVEGTSLPAGLGLRLGRFLLPYGKQNPLHTHQFPFTGAPVASTAFLGHHSVVETGAWLVATVPLPWYSDLKVYGANGDSEIFDAGNNDLVWGGRWVNLWDVSDNATFELSGSLFSGPDGAHPGEGKQLTDYGADLTYKWVSASRSHGPALVVTGEVIVPRPQERVGNPIGWYAQGQYRFHRNWWFGTTIGRADADTPSDGTMPDEHAHGFTGDIWEYKINVTYAPSEFSALRAEVEYYDDRVGDGDDLRFIVQLNFTIGSHPAHLY